MDAIAAPVVLLRADAHIVSWNMAHAALVGIAPGTGVDRPLKDFVHAPREALASIELAARGEVPAIDLKWRREDGGAVQTVTAFRAAWRESSDSQWIVATSTAGSKQGTTEAMRAFFEVAPMGVIAIDSDGSLTANARAEEILGMRLSRDAGVRQYAPRLRHLDGSPISADDLPSMRALREGVRVGAEALQVERDDGTKVTILESAAPVLGPDSRIVGSVVILEDVTARLRHEAIIAESVVAVAGDPIIVIDEGQRILLFNARAEQTFGWSAAEAMGQQIDVLLPERFRVRHREQIASFVGGTGEARRMADGRSGVIGLRRDGSEFPIDASIARANVGSRTMLTVVLRDVTTERKREADQRFLAQASVTLVSSLEYEQTLNSVARLAVPAFADGCIVNLVVGEGEKRLVRRLKVAHVDPHMQERLSAVETWPARDVANQPIWRELFAGKSVLYGDLPSGPLPIPVENAEHERLLKALNALSLIVVPMVARERVLGTISFITSTSGRRYSQNELRMAEELAMRAALAVDNAQLYAAAQGAVRAREEVLAFVAHDLRNPLNSIHLNLQALAREARSHGLDVESARHIAHSVQRANGMISDLLDVARIDAGALVVDLRPCDPIELLQEASQQLLPLAEAAQIELVFDAARELPKVFADPPRIARVFANFVDNALKFTGSKGRVSVTAARDQDVVRFSVSDTGPGMTAEQLAHVFDRFWQANRRDRRGAGLGLAIASGLVEAHGGTVSVASEQGAGTTFSFTLRVAP